MDEINNQQKSTEFIDISEIFRILKKRKKIIFITTLILTAFTFFVSMFIIPPKYSASTNILVNRKETNDQMNAQVQIQADVQMINTYKDIITSPTILDDVSAKLKNKGYVIDPDKIKNCISITSEQNSQVFTVNVKTDNPNLSAILANTTAQVFKKKVVKIMSINNVSILSKAQVNPKPVSPKIMMNTIIGLLAGLVLGIILAFVFNSLDRTVNDMSFITDELELNDLGIINEIPEKNVEKLVLTTRRKFSSNRGNRRV